MVQVVCALALASGVAPAQNNAFPSHSSQAREFNKLLSQAEHGNTRAQILVGEAYRKGDGTPADVNESVRWFSRAANSGDPIAQAELAVSYLSGPSPLRDPRLAFAWYLRSATAGLPLSQNEVGSMFFMGLGVRHDEEEAVRWFQRAAAKGYAPAQANLGFAYSQGRGVAPNPKLALKWLKQAARKHEALALFHLAYIYDGCYCGFPDNPALAAKWYEKAAALGHPAAESNLAILYTNGTGVPRNLERALQLFTRSAQHGNTDAYWALYRFHSQGLATPVDKVKGLAWLMLAAQANSASPKISAELAKAMQSATTSVVDAADGIVRAWQAIHTPESLAELKLKYGLVVGQPKD
jgi:TPR repeat protein